MRLEPHHVVASLSNDKDDEPQIKEPDLYPHYNNDNKNPLLLPQQQHEYQRQERLTNHTYQSPLLPY